MRSMVAIGVLATMLVAAVPAQGGGWATVGVDGMPAGIGPGDTWRPEITVLQHGETPLAGLTPTLTITEEGTGESRAFTAVATDAAGVYEAAVVFPEAGDWNVYVETGWWGEGNLTFGPVAIEDAPGGVVGSDDLPVVPVALVALVLALLAAGAFGARRMWRPSTAGR